MKKSFKCRLISLLCFTQYGAHFRLRHGGQLARIDPADFYFMQQEYTSVVDSLP